MLLGRRTIRPKTPPFSCDVDLGNESSTLLVGHKVYGGRYRPRRTPNHSTSPSETEGTGLGFRSVTFTLHSCTRTEPVGDGSTQVQPETTSVTPVLSERGGLEERRRVTCYVEVTRGL